MGVFLDWGSMYQKDPEKWREWMGDNTLYAAAAPAAQQHRALLLWSWITLMISCMHIHPFPQVLDE